MLTRGEMMKVTWVMEVMEVSQVMRGSRSQELEPPQKRLKTEQHPSENLFLCVKARNCCHLDNI